MKDHRPRKIWIVEGGYCTDTSVAVNVWEALHFAKGLIANENLFELANEPINRNIIHTAWQQSSSKYYAVDETQDERSSSNIVAMRDFHNNVKRALYMAASKGCLCICPSGFAGLRCTSCERQKPEAGFLIHHRRRHSELCT
ncbi:TPA: hypothetical protein ACH3X2_004341 [Trebouxia sp. C0005]